MSKIQLLTDELIHQYSENNVLTEYRDINLKISTELSPYPKGVYDKDIFGSLFSDRCNCGLTRRPGVLCPHCGSMILDEVQSFRHFARIESPVYYTNRYKLNKVVEFLKNNFNIVSRFTLPQFQDTAWNDGRNLDICQWNLLSKDDYKLEITDEVTDFTQCSYEGILKILTENYPELVQEFKSYINLYILVIPMALRAPMPKIEDGTKKVDNHEITTIYQAIIYAIQEYYNNTIGSMNTELGKAILRGSLRKLISTSLDGLSKLMNSSKENLARTMQSNQIPNSGRCVIVPDPTLNADEVMIPRHIMYEMCRTEFIKYLAEKKNITEKAAEVIYKTQSDLDEVQQLFTQYIEGDPNIPNSGKYVLINRQPTLYELGMCVCKVKLTYDYAMKLPQVLCVPFNADFDGDTMAFYAIPKEMNSLMNSTMSPRNQFLYKKSHKPLYTPTHEMLMGLTISSKLIVPDKLKTFYTLEEALEYRKNNPDFKYQTCCIIDNKKTTIGRYILSDLFDKDIDGYLETLGESNLTAKNMTILYEQLKDKPDRLERIHKIQEFALKVATLSGSTAPRISDLYIDIDKSYLDKMREIESNPKMSENQKQLAIREIYAKFQEDALNRIPEGLRTMINESGRAKIEQLRDMAVQQLNIDPKKKVTIGETTLAGGLSPLDLERHAIEQRGVQDIKQLSVPQSGYVTRQFIYLASELYFAEGSDESNVGIKMKRKDAEGRTTVSGEVLGKSKSNEEVLVRSIVSSKNSGGKVTQDLIPVMFKYKVGARVGMSMISSLTETLTQAGLKLKHQGNLYNLDPMNSLSAPEDGTVEDRGDFIVFIGDSKSEYKYPKPNDVVINYSPDNRYKKGEKFMTNFQLTTQTYGVDSLIKLCQARSVNPDKSFQHNRKLVSECYAIEDGVIKYEMTDYGISVVVGNMEYIYNPDCLYLYPEGTKIKKYQRICTGTLDMKSMVTKITDYIELFYYFRNQFTELLDSISPELIEFTYVLLTTNHGDHIEMRSVLQNIHGSDSFFKSLAFGDARKSFNKIDYDGMQFVADPITSVILSLITNDELN